MASDWTFSPYQWRGKTYKTVTGITGAAARAYPGSGVAFDADHMVLSFKLPKGDRGYVYFRRTMAVDGKPHLIEDKPCRTEVRVNGSPGR